LELKKKNNLTLSQAEWQEAFDACVANRDKVVAEDFGGRMIQPLIGATFFTEESKVH